MNKIYNFTINRRPSTWLIIISLILTSTMMHPNFATLIVLFCNTIILFGARWMAGFEQDLINRKKIIKK